MSDHLATRQVTKWGQGKRKKIKSTNNDFYHSPFTFTLLLEKVNLGKVSKYVWEIYKALVKNFLVCNINVAIMLK